jgi:hypothetical protein
LWQKYSRGQNPNCFGPYLYGARNLIERFFNKIRHATRYDELAANQMAFRRSVTQLWLRANWSAAWYRTVSDERAESLAEHASSGVTAKKDAALG